MVEEGEEEAPTLLSIPVEEEGGGPLVDPPPPLVRARTWRRRTVVADGINTGVACQVERRSSGSGD